MSSHTCEIDVLGRTAEALVREIPGLEWRPPSGQMRRGIVHGPRYYLALGRRGNFGWFSCHGLVPAEPRTFWEMNSALIGPSRLVQLLSANVAHLEATWPWLITPEPQAAILAADLRRLLGPTEFSMAQKGGRSEHFSGSVLKANDSVLPLPTVGSWWEARVGRGSAARQVAFRRPHAQAVAASTLVANWTAEGSLEQQAAARLAMMINRRLRWVRLVLYDTTINAEVTLPDEGFHEQMWGLVRDALTQAVRSCRTALRLVQSPAVAAQFLRLYPLGGKLS